MRIVIAGLSACGKTTVAEIIAKTLSQTGWATDKAGYPVVIDDSDTAKTVSEIAKGASAAVPLVLAGGQYRIEIVALGNNRYNITQTDCRGAVKTRLECDRQTLQFFFPTMLDLKVTP